MNPRVAGSRNAATASNSTWVPLLLLMSLVGVVMVSSIGHTAENQSVPGRWLTYADPEDRFSFSYPASFGAVSKGTDSGFGDTVSAIRFSAFSSGVRDGKIVLAGEAVLTRGRVMVQGQAVGGLYDSITLQAFPEPLQETLSSQLSLLQPSNFCQELGKQQHLEAGDPVLESLLPAQKDAVLRMDRMGNADPRVVRCDVSGDVVVFHKEASFEAGQSKGRRHIYGAIRFLAPPNSSFQLVRITADVPDELLLHAMAEIVRSFTSGRISR